MTAEHLPEPLTPSEADLQDFPYTPIYRAWLFGSSFHAKANDAEWRAGVTLWLKAQDQKPAGSLPDDDLELCRLAELGRDTKTWKKLRPRALHGWFKCSDGRLYHEVVAKVTNEQWQEKLDQRNRTRNARIAALEKRLSDAKTQSAKENISAELQRLRQEAVTAPPQKPVTETKGRKGKEREGNKERENPTQPSSSDAARGEPVSLKGGVGFDPRFGEVVRRASEILSNPNVLVWNRVEVWLKSGADPELDIYPTLTSAKPQWRSNNLQFFDHHIANAKATRLKPMPDGQARHARSNGAVPIAQTSQSDADEVERINAGFIRSGSYQSDVSLSQVRAMISKGLLTTDEARKAGYAA